MANSNVPAVGCLWLAAALALGGCTRGPREYPVSGEVNFRGEKVTDGEIIFADVAAVAPSVRSVIVDGRYSLQSTAGQKLVRISATRETGKMVAGGMDVQVPERIDWIPPQYNVESKLKCEVAADAAQTINFDLP